MGVGERVKDRRVLKLIRANLNNGVMVIGVVMEAEEGTPQGGSSEPGEIPGVQFLKTQRESAHPPHLPAIALQQSLGR
jgi:hypothetical protein